MRRIFFPVVAFLFLFIIILVGGWFYFKQLPELIAGLPPESSRANQVFYDRVTTRFPVGSSEAALTTALRAEGFVLGTNSTWRTATFTRTRNVVKELWVISWQADSAGTITELETNYGFNGPYRK